MRRYVITGAPGTGKTALVRSLADFGEVVGEPARELIAEHRERTGEWSLDQAPELFVKRLAERSIQKFDAARGTDLVIFDRGLPDCVAYARGFGVSPDAVLKAAKTRRYSDPVLVAPPWEEIYVVDDMRRATFEQVAEFHSFLINAYEELGYDLVELPKAAVEARRQFVTNLLSL